MDVDQLAFRLFGRFLREKDFSELRERLEKARNYDPPAVYVSTSILYSIVIALLAGLGVYIVLSLLPLPIPGILAAPVLGAVVGVGVYMFFIYFYPGVLSGERSRKIDSALPHACTYMYALSQGGKNITEIFKALSGRTDMESIAQEAKVFMRDVKVLGHDPVTALHRLRESTPSERFSNFLEVLGSMVESGGDETSYFRARSKEYREVEKKNQEENIMTLEFLGELYIMMIAFSPLLFLTMLSVMQLIQPIPDEFLIAVAYFWIPLGSLGFGIVLSTLSREEIEGPPPEGGGPDEFKDVRVTSSGSEEGSEVPFKTKFREAFGSFRGILDNPEYMLILSIPLAALFLVYTVYFIQPVSIGLTEMVWGFVIAAAPYSVVYELKQGLSSRAEGDLPDVLRVMENASESGLTLEDTITVAADSTSGPLGEELEKTRDKIEWGKSSAEALEEMSQNIDSPPTSRAMNLIATASRSKEDVSDTISIVREDVEAREELEENRGGAMMVYELLLLITFGVYLITTYYLVSNIITIQPGSMEGAGGGSISTFDVPFVKQLFSHSLLLEGAGTGFLAAKMGSDDFKLGLKFSILLIVISWIFFEFVISPI